MSGAAAIDVSQPSALQIGAMLAARLLEAEEVAERTLASIRACDDQAIFTRLTEGRALIEARAASRRIRAGRPRSLLDGVPIAWKDLFDLEGIVTTAGSKVLDRDAPALRDFSARFGALQTGLVSSEPGVPEVSILSNVKEGGKLIGIPDAGQDWHTDMTYNRIPGFVNVLVAHRVPVRDGVVLGATEFCDTAAAYEGLPEALAFDAWRTGAAGSSK
jgi:hypothetical protein